jgi:hypothetical protein
LLQYSRQILMRRVTTATAAPSFGVVALLLVLAWRDGGFDASNWGPATVVLVALLALALASGAAAPATHREWVVLGAGAAFVLWSYLTATWAAFPGNALVGSGKTLLYFACFAIAMLLPGRAGRYVLLAFGFGVAAIAAIVLVRLAVSADPASSFLDNRLEDPIGYSNGDACFWALGPCALLLPAASRTAGSLLRAAGFGSIVLLIDIGILSQSRAWFYLLPLAGLVGIALARDRWHTAGACVVCAVPALAAAPIITRVYDQGPVAHTVRVAVAAAAGAAAAGVVAGLVWSAAARRLPPAPARLRAAAVGLVVALVIAGVGAAVAKKPRVLHPVGMAHSLFDNFKTPYIPEEAGKSRFTGSLSSDRYREWTVAYRAFVSSPVVGVGSDNYEAYYLRQRGDALFDPKFPHSTPLRLLSQLGLIGTLLFVVWVGCAGWGILAARRSDDPDVALAAQGGVLVFLYWLAHGSVDWFWEIPALAAPSFALLGLGAGSLARPERRLSTGRRAALAAAVAAPIVLVLPPWFENVLVTHGAAASSASTQTADTDFRWAARVDPWSAEPYLYLGSLELNRGRLSAAATAFRRAAKREPQNWYAYLQLGVTAVQAGDFPEAAREVDAARRLNPKDPVAALAARLVRRRIVFPPSLLNSFYVAKVNQRFGAGIRL